MRNAANFVVDVRVSFLYTVDVIWKFPSMLFILNQCYYLKTE